MGVYLFMWGKHETVELWQKTKPYFPCQDLDWNKMAPWAKPRLNKNEEVNWIFRFVSWSYTIITSDPFMNTFINFHLACLTKEAWMNALSIASLFPQERSRTLSNESKPCLSCLSLSLSLGWRDAATRLLGFIGCHHSPCMTRSATQRLQVSSSLWLMLF